MLKSELLKESGIYLVTDRRALKGKDIIATLSRSLEAGIDIVQLRDKEASDREFFDIGRKIKNLLRRKKTLFVIDDRVEMALALDSDGVHLGQDDMPVAVVRKMLGRRKIIGLSTHSIDQMRAAVKKDVDYISIGPVFPTPTKPDYRPVGLELVRIAAKESRIPFVAIGGIDETNIEGVVAAGAKRIAVVRAILSAEDPFIATKRLYDTVRVRKTE